MDIKLFKPDMEWRKYGLLCGIESNPDSPVTIREMDRSHEQEAICPYCGDKMDRYEIHQNIETNGPYHDSWETDEEMHVIECNCCEREYCIRYHFGYGINSTPAPCKKGHNPEFTAQYIYQGDLVRLSTCITCGKTTDYHSSKLQIFIDPDLFPEAHDPDFWDPDGLLISKEMEYKPTPILDEIQNQIDRPWGEEYHCDRLLVALHHHEREYQN